MKAALLLSVSSGFDVVLTLRHLRSFFGFSVFDDVDWCVSDLFPFRLAAIDGHVRVDGGDTELLVICDWRARTTSWSPEF